MSERITKFSFSLIKPIEIPAIADFIGIPASIIAREVPQAEAIEEDPLDSITSDTTRIVYEKLEKFGITAIIPLFTRFPCPISLLFGTPTNPISPTE